MIVSLLLGASSVVDAERAFAARAQVVGQWTAFRETAAPDAILFWPRAKNAFDALKGLEDPAKSVIWWPTGAWQSCDGTLAVTTGGALWPDGRHGWFTTVWRKQANGSWKWVLDHGGFAAKARPAPVTVAITKPAKCRKVTLPPPSAPGGLPADGYWRQSFASSDGTLVVTGGTSPTVRSVTVLMSSATRDELVLQDIVETPAR